MRELYTVTLSSSLSKTFPSMSFPLSTQVSLQVSLQKLIAYGIVHFVYEQVVYSLQHHWWLVWEVGGGGVTVGSSLSLLLQKKHKKRSRSRK